MALNDVDFVKELIEDLEVNIDELDEALKPLVSQSLIATANSLPLLDRAKLFTTAVYAIDSLLYNSLNIAGTDAKTHAIKTELDRVKQYFDKIKAAENPVGKRENLALDKPAAARFITAALRGNDKYDQERAERETRERASADAKLQALNGKRKDLSQEEHNPNKKNLETSDSEASPSKFHLILKTRCRLMVTIDPVKRKKSNKPPRTKAETAELLKQGPLPKKDKKTRKKEKRKSLQAQQE